mmetsp:Transcript_16247/g.35164  ORF Transcript_16247/g.35164 Transcript_16247/m.35164 type:complete len:374 (+) Transcript_16247:95-1216(+)
MQVMQSTNSKRADSKNSPFGNAGRTVLGGQVGAAQRRPSWTSVSGSRPGSSAGVHGQAEDEQEEDWRQMRASIKNRGSVGHGPSMASKVSSSSGAGAAGNPSSSSVGIGGSATLGGARERDPCANSMSGEGSGSTSMVAGTSNAGARRSVAAATAQELEAWLAPSETSKPCSATASKNAERQDGTPEDRSDPQTKDVDLGQPPVLAPLKSAPTTSMASATMAAASASGTGPGAFPAALPPLRLEPAAHNPSKPTALPQVAVPPKILQQARDKCEERESAYLGKLRAEAQASSAQSSLDSLVRFLEMNNLSGSYALGFAAGGVDDLSQLLLAEESSINRAIEGSSMDAVDEILFREALHSARGHPTYTPRISSR